MIKIEHSKGGNIEYRIDEGNNTITATLYCSYRDPQMLFDKTVKNFIKGNGIGPVSAGWDNEKYYINDCYIGKAKCHPDDTFDIEFGKRLALARAKAKYYRSIAVKIWKMKFYYDMLSNILDGLDSKYYTKWFDATDEVYDIENSVR